MMTDGDGEEVGCATTSAKKKDRWAVRFKLSSINADWPGEGWKKVIGLDQ